MLPKLGGVPMDSKRGVAPQHTLISEMMGHDSESTTQTYLSSFEKEELYKATLQLVHPTLTPENLLSHFSFHHFIALMRIKDPLKRAFYEKEAIKGKWEARFLERK